MASYLVTYSCKTLKALQIERIDGPLAYIQALFMNRGVKTTFGKIFKLHGRSRIPEDHTIVSDAKVEPRTSIEQKEYYIRKKCKVDPVVITHI